MIGIVHPGNMGAAIAGLLDKAAWASQGRSSATRVRAAGLTDLGTIARLKDNCEIVLSVCPPHAAVETARQFRDYPGLYADLNAISPATCAEVARLVPRFVDGGIIGPPPVHAGTTRVYLAGPQSPAVAALFEGTALDARVLPGPAGDASALKMTYAAWTKGTTALLLATRAAARSLGVEDELLREWELSQPSLPGRSQDAARLGRERGWRWAYELEETGRTFADAGLPDGFGIAAGEVYRRLPRDGDGDAFSYLTGPGSPRS
ncbi:NAD(P)-dependent oxidoreductase [Amycolatopsis sp. K13G38]|uniref:NAD(P)-dependent oxidoreductase n=1 Tax=Amycolatopsis acididurans TaxID=2724524 RepID=A0ABX1J5R8_9PSEU|nr:NAD(P)-dependent oxidoreductase [Amycolatopsis acididurans]NKQ53632.1 NAD(P)-dependent oxidoreductase [Amycolatopsis acididurans]